MTYSERKAVNSPTWPMACKKPRKRQPNDYLFAFESGLFLKPFAFMANME